MTSRLKAELSGAANASEIAANLLTVKFNGSEFIRILRSDEFPEKDARLWVQDHFYLAIQASILYVSLVFGAQYLMRHRRPFKLFVPLLLWNFALAIFSIGGLWHMSADFFGVIHNNGVKDSYCKSHNYTHGSTGFWAWLFIVSKLVELGDTMFLVLRKRPLIFLHWYHHILTLMSAFYSFPLAPAFIRIGIYLNYFVHAFMYTYYFLRSARFKVPMVFAVCVTLLQILQFVISVAVLVHLGYLIFVQKEKCDFDLSFFWICVFMDVSYLILFVDFFLNAYVYNEKNGAKSKIEEPHAKSGGGGLSNGTGVVTRSGAKRNGDPMAVNGKQHANGTAAAAATTNGVASAKTTKPAKRAQKKKVD